MTGPIAVEPREDYRIWLRYSDGAEGEVDLSDLAGGGVFSAWDDRACFEAVHMTEYGAIAWSEELELCPDALYMRLTASPSARSCRERWKSWAMPEVCRFYGIVIQMNFGDHAPLTSMPDTAAAAP